MARVQTAQQFHLEDVADVWPETLTFYGAPAEAHALTEIVGDVDEKALIAVVRRAIQSFRQPLDGDQTAAPAVDVVVEFPEPEPAPPVVEQVVHYLQGEIKARRRYLPEVTALVVIADLVWRAVT